MRLPGQGSCSSDPPGGGGGGAAPAARRNPGIGRTARPRTVSEADRLVEQGSRPFGSAPSLRGGAVKSHLEQAEVYFRRALAVDPGHAVALCAMGGWYYVMGNHRYAPQEESYAKGRELVLAALAADDRCAEVHNSLGKIALYYDDDWHAAARHIRRAIELDPNDPEMLRSQSIVYKILGRVDDAVQAARDASPGPAMFRSTGMPPGRRAARGNERLRRPTRCGRPSRCSPGTSPRSSGSSRPRSASASPTFRHSRCAPPAIQFW